MSKEQIIIEPRFEGSYVISFTDSLTYSDLFDKNTIIRCTNGYTLYIQVMFNLNEQDFMNTNSSLIKIESNLFNINGNEFENKLRTCLENILNKKFQRNSKESNKIIDKLFKSDVRVPLYWIINEKYSYKISVPWSNKEAKKCIDIILDVKNVESLIHDHTKHYKKNSVNTSIGQVDYYSMFEYFFNEQEHEHRGLSIITKKYLDKVVSNKINQLKKFDNDFITDLKNEVEKELNNTNCKLNKIFDINNIDIEIRQQKIDGDI